MRYLFDPYALHNQKINNYNNLGTCESYIFEFSLFIEKNITPMFFPPSHSGHRCFFIGSGKQQFLFSPGQWRRIVDLCFWQVSSFCIECCPWLHLGVQGFSCGLVIAFSVERNVITVSGCILQLSEVKP